MYSLSVCLIIKYAYGVDVFCFDVVIIASSDLITHIFCAAPLASWQCYDCPSACDLFLKDMRYIDQY